MEKVTIENWIIGGKFVFMSPDFPTLFIADKNYDVAYNALSIALNPLLIAKFPESIQQVKLEWEVQEGIYSLH